MYNVTLNAHFSASAQQKVMPYRGRGENCHSVLYSSPYFS